MPKIKIDHKKCNCEIRWKAYTNGHNIPGLFCKEHGAWIKWLTREDAFYAIKILNVPVEKYKS